MFLPKLWCALIKKKNLVCRLHSRGISETTDSNTRLCFIWFCPLCILSLSNRGMFFLRCLSGRVEPSWRGKERTNTLFWFCVQRSARTWCKISKPPQLDWRGAQPSAFHPRVAWSSASGRHILDVVIVVQVHHFWPWKLKNKRFPIQWSEGVKGLFFCASSPFGKAKVDCSCVCSLMKYWNEFFFFSFFFFYILIPNWSLSSPSTLWHWVVICNLFWLCAAKK